MINALLGAVLRTAALFAGMVLLVAGAIMAPLPIPLGLPSIALGLVLIAAASKRAHVVITSTLRKFPWLWEKVRFAFRDRD